MLIPVRNFKIFFSIQSFLKVFATWHINFTKFFYLCYRDFKIKTSPILEKFDPTRETGGFYLSLLKIFTFVDYGSMHTFGF